MDLAHPLGPVGAGDVRAAGRTPDHVIADRAEFGDWVRPHWAAMHSLARRLASPGDAEDALQEALTAAWRKRGQFDERRGTPRNWLLAIVADQSRKSRRRFRPVAAVRGTETAAPDALPDLDLRRAVTALPERQRLAVELRYYLQLPVEEIADVMSCAPGTVKSTLSAARQNLRNRLGEDHR